VACERCQNAPAPFYAVLRTPEGAVLRTPSGNCVTGCFCEPCYYTHFGKRPTAFETRSYLPTIAILAGLDAAIVCLATAPWLLMNGVSSQLLLVPVVNGPLIGILLVVEVALLNWAQKRGRDKAKSTRRYGKGARPSSGVYDPELDD
jgi:hypothetical protein